MFVRGDFYALVAAHAEIAAIDHPYRSRHTGQRIERNIWGHVFQVLFLKKMVAVDGHTEAYYRRIGIGMLFGNDVKSCLKQAEERDIFLA